MASKALDGAIQTGRVTKPRYTELVAQLATAMLVAKDSVTTRRQQLVWTTFDDVLAVHEMGLEGWSGAARIWAPGGGYTATAYSLYRTNTIRPEATARAGEARAQLNEKHRAERERRIAEQRAALAREAAEREARTPPLRRW